MNSTSCNQPNTTGCADQVPEFRQLQKRTRLWAGLSQVSQVISSTLEPDQVLRLILEQAVSVLEAVGGSLILVEPQSRELVFELALGPTAANLVGTHMPWGKGLVGEAAATGRPLVVNDTTTDPRWFSGYDEATDFVTQRILCAPMIFRQEVIGVLEIVNKRDGSPFDEDETELLQALASQAATALTNARLYTAARRQAEEVSALLETSQAVNSTLDLDQRLRIVATRAQALITADGCTILLLDEDGQTLRPIIALDLHADAMTRVSLRRGEAISGQVALTGKGRVVNQAHLDPEALVVPGTAEQPECLLSVPLQVKGVTSGVMTLTRLGERQFTRHDLELISSLGNQAAVAIENARLYSATWQRNRELTALYSIAVTIGQTLEMSQLLEEVVRQAPDILGLCGGAVFLFPERGQDLKLVHHDGFAAAALSLMSDSEWVAMAIGRAAATRRAVEVPLTLPADATLAGEPQLVCIPLVSHERVLGVLAIPSDQTRPLGSGEKRLLETLGRQIGMAIENASLYAQLQDRAMTLQRAYDDLAEVDRLKDELVQNISHELRTPITFIKGYVSLMLDGELGGLSQDQIKSLEIVARKTEQLIRLVNGILTLQTLTPDTLRMEPVSAIDLASQAIDGAKLAAEEAGIGIIADYPDVLPRIIADPSRITQVFDNLLQNALKFSARGDTIRVRMRTTAGRLRVDIQDTGIGIPADKVSQIFDRFFQVDGSMTRRFGGAGLGLAICKQIVDAHDGEIMVESQEGVGSIFSFTLPLAPAEG